MGEGLRKINGELSDLKFTPDADVPFLIHLETEILQYLKGPIDNADAQGLSQIPSGPGQPPGPALPPQAGPGPLTPPGGAPGAPGLSAGPGAINPDELRRVLSQGQ